MVIWHVSNNILKNQNTYPVESWCTRPSKTRSNYTDLASKLARFWKFIFKCYFNQRNGYADKIWWCSQRFQWKYLQKENVFAVTVYKLLVQKKY